MEMESVEKEIERILEEFGPRPYDFFSILTNSDNPNSDLRSQNDRLKFVKSETWHSLNLDSYVLWAVSDNGDLLWWNGEQTIAMAHRDSSFVSEPVMPLQFLRIVGIGNVGNIFPKSLWSEDV